MASSSDKTVVLSHGFGIRYFFFAIRFSQAVFTSAVTNMLPADKQDFRRRGQFQRPG